MREGKGTITQLLQAWQGGDRAAFDALVPQIYQELHGIAGRALHRERSDHTLRATDLVSEAYLRLADSSANANDRVHFFAIAARCMRQILCDHARKKLAHKRVAPPAHEDPAVAPLGILELDGVIAALAEKDERKARVVELSYFGGLTQDEIAIALDVSLNTVARDLKFAIAWIRSELASRE